MALFNERQWDYILNESWPAQAVQGLLSAARMPGDAYMGKYAGQPTEAIIPDATDFAMNVGLLGSAIPRPAGSIGMGGMPTRQRIQGYHGSPHDFPAERLVRDSSGNEHYITGSPDLLPEVPEGMTVIKDFPLGRFRSDKIGTGEGAQAYGQGSYLAESEGLARYYRDKLAPMNTNVKSALRDAGGDFDKAIAETQDRINHYKAMEPSRRRDSLLSINETKLNELLSQKAGNAPNPGKMYEVNINANQEHFLDWDKPLSKQSEAVRNALKKLDVDTGGMTAKDRIETIEAAMSGDPRLAHLLGKNSVNITGDTIYKGMSNALGAVDWPVTSDAATRAQYRGKAEALTSEELRKAGIPGIRYFDANSRGITTKSADEWAKEISDIEKTIEFHKNSLKKFKGTRAESGTLQSISDLERQLEIAKGKMANESGTRNYVVFDPSIIEILRKYGIAGLLGGGALAIGAGQDQAQAQGTMP